LFAPAQAAGKGAETAATNLSSDLVPNALEGLSFGSIAQVDPTAALGAAVGSGAGSAGGAIGDILVTATRPTNILPSAIGGTAISNILTEAAKANAEGATNTQTDRQDMTPGQMASVSGLPTGSSILSGLTKNLGVTDYLTLAGLAGSGISSLLGGGGTGAGAGTPYVSPFGAGGTFGNVAGRDMRAQPAIEDYERYGFGPEATFFQPAYNTLVSGAAGTNPTTTPTYRPLI
jgi:hypothetical protein